MSRTVSFRDLQLCTAFAGMNEIAMLRIENDAAMAEVLSQIGFDVEYPITYVPSKHRDMQNKVGVGYMCVGDISINRKFVNSYLCSTVERMIAASYSDPSLTRELGALMGHHVNYRSLLEDDAEWGGEELPEDMLEPDRREVAALIQSLAELRDSIRGSQYNESGDLKCYEEYRCK
jgi:hypothetical protein